MKGVQALPAVAAVVLLSVTACGSSEVVQSDNTTTMFQEWRASVTKLDCQKVNQPIWANDFKERNPELDVSSSDVGQFLLLAGTYCDGILQN